MKKSTRDDYWPPRPGSWEEAVDPYDVQFSRERSLPPNGNDKRELPMEMLPERRPNISIPASL